MPAPVRELPQQLFKYSGLFPKGIQGHYNDAEIDTLLEAYVSKDDLQQAISGIDLGGNIDLSGYVTQQDLADALSGSGGVAQHSSPLPQLTQGATPLDIVAAWAGYESGVHRFENGAVAVLFKSDISDTNSGRPTESKSVSVTVLLPGEGTTYVKAVTTAVDGTQSEADSVVVSQAGGQWFALTSKKGDEPFANPKMADLFALSGGGGGVVFEQDTQPDSAKDGDLWLAPAADAAIVINDALTKQEPLPALDHHVAELVRKLISGGKTLPPDIDWTPCTKILGSGLIEARVLNGMIQLRGELIYTMSSVGTFSNVQRLPANFPKPPAEQNCVVFGYESGVAYRRVFVRFNTSGDIAICGDGKITGTVLTGAQAYAY